MGVLIRIRSISAFSAGIDSGAVFLLTYHALRELGESPSRLKAFTLSVDGGGADLIQARQFLEKLNLEMFLEPVELDYTSLDWKKAVRMVEDYKPLDIESATMNLALLQGIRSRYTEWKHIFSGEGGDENLKDYPIEENPELTIKSVLNNLMLYHEGWDHQRLYDLKGQIVSSGIKAVTGMEMPVYPKRRFQHGAAASDIFRKHFPEKETAYRKEFLSLYE